MRLELIMWHHNRELAIAKGLGSDTEHIFPYADAFCSGDSIACRYLWDHRCYEPVAILKPAISSNKIVSPVIVDLCEELYKETQHGIDPRLPGGWNVSKEGNCRETPTFSALHRTDNRSSMTGDIIEVNLLDKQVLQTTLYIVSAIGFTILQSRTHTLPTKG